MAGCWVIIVGPAGAGKTTVSGYIRQELPTFRYTSDLAALEQLFAFNDAHVGTTRNATEQRPTLWCGLDADPYLNDQATRRLRGGGHDILDPSVWDAALRSVVRHAREYPHVIVEFARGLDPSYMKLHDLVSDEAYAPSFRLLAEELRGARATTAVVVHVTAPLDVRIARNVARRNRGEHYVADRVMRSTYRDDVFRDAAVELLQAYGLCTELRHINTTQGGDAGVASLIESLRARLDPRICDR